MGNSSKFDVDLKRSLCLLNYRSMLRSLQSAEKAFNSARLHFSRELELLMDISMNRNQQCKTVLYPLFKKVARLFLNLKNKQMDILKSKFFYEKFKGKTYNKRSETQKPDQRQNNKRLHFDRRRLFNFRHSTNRTRRTGNPGNRAQSLFDVSELPLRLRATCRAQKIQTADQPQSVLSVQEQVCLTSLIVFETLDSLNHFVSSCGSFWKSFNDMQRQYPSLILLMNHHLTDPCFAMFKEVFLKPRNQVFVETVDKGIQTPVHFVEKHIGRMLGNLKITTTGGMNGICAEKCFKWSTFEI